LVKGVEQVGSNLKGGQPVKALHQAIITGIKLADENVFYNELSSALQVAAALKALSTDALSWTPEVLCAEIDKKFRGWSSERVASAIAHFHKTGTLLTDVPQLVREKIYAIRIVATSNSAQTEWHIFEKVGGAFNDRVAKFGEIEPLSAAEAAKTVAIIEDIRPDVYDNEVKIYIAGCCHQDGLYTIEAIKWLRMSEPYLRQMNRDSTGDPFDPSIGAAIGKKLNELRSLETIPDFDESDVVSVQAGKLLAIELIASKV
jgi:hypothetical protein